MNARDLAGKPAPPALLADIPLLVSAYYTEVPDPDDPNQRVSFGTSGHRGSSLKGSFNEAHIAAIAQAIHDYRQAQGIDGPLFLGRDTHALSYPALGTALEVFAAQGVNVILQEGLGYTPTPVISHAILTHNQNRTSGLADGVVITPSHNPPEDGGFKYNPPHGGPAGAETTAVIQDRANALLPAWRQIRRRPLARALKADTTRQQDYIGPYVHDLENVVDLEAIAQAGLRLGVDPLGGAAVHYFDRIADRYGLDLTVVNRTVDPTFGFMTVDHDGKIRMDCSSPYAMARLIGNRERFDLAFGNDPDADRHGIVTPREGLLNPNHYLAVAVDYLFRHRPHWRADAAVGKTLVSSAMIDRVAQDLHRRLAEVPVGFKWFVEGLLSGVYGFGGEESAGAAFLRRDGRVWTTDKDGLIMDLLAAEIMAVTGQSPAERYHTLEARFGQAFYARHDAPASRAARQRLQALTPQDIDMATLAGETVQRVLTRAPENDAALGGIKVVSANAWFAARPSGTEEIYKLYAESFLGPDHLARIQQEALGLVQRILATVLPT